MGRPIFARRLLPQEREELDALLYHSIESLARRAAIVLLSSEERYHVSEISILVGMHMSSVRYWIHRFNKEGMMALQPREPRGWGPRVDPGVRATLIQLATTPPRELGLKFTSWTLRELEKYLVEREIVQEISHETIRRILKDENIDWRVAGTLSKDSLITELLGA
jgi:transposase